MNHYYENMPNRTSAPTKCHRLMSITRGLHKKADAGGAHWSTAGFCNPTAQLQHSTGSTHGPAACTWVWAEAAETDVILQMQDCTSA